MSEVDLRYTPPKIYVDEIVKELINDLSKYDINELDKITKLKYIHYLSEDPYITYGIFYEYKELSASKFIDALKLIKDELKDNYTKLKLIIFLLQLLHLKSRNFKVSTLVKNLDINFECSLDSIVNYLISVVELVKLKYIHVNIFNKLVNFIEECLVKILPDNFKFKVIEILKKVSTQ